jgi:ribonucleotide reductase alpha subunit
MNDNILKLLQDRYFLKDEKTWGDLVERVSVLYPEIKPYMLDMEFIPSTPTLQNANTKGERQGTLSSCFILKVKDSIEDIYDAIKEGAVVTKNGGGCGWNFSYLRSSKENINSLNANSSGPIAFIGGFNQMLDDIRQGGKRRGAGLGSLSIHHGDILEFINIKNDLTKLNRMNLSSRMTNKFYKQLNEDSNSIHQVFDRNGTYFDLEDKEGKKVTVKQIWDLIVEQAWKVAEPGLFNEDIAFDRCTVTNLDTEVSGNPCVEFTGIPYQSCNLGSINLSKLIKGTVFDWEKFEQLVKHGVRFLNQVIDHNKFPLKKIKEITLKTRPIGLGVMGLAHILYKLKIPYNSKLALDFAYSLFNKMTLIGMQESVELSKKIMGAGAYSAFDYDLFMKANERFFKYDDLEEIKKLKKDIKKYGIRNSAITSIAPTGCKIKESEIQTDKGILSLEEIFLKNGINLNKLEKRDKRNKFNEIICYDKENNIIKEDFYYNYTLIKVDENNAKWVKNTELKERDIVIKIKK